MPSIAYSPIQQFQIRNSIKYVGSKHQKEFLKDLKLVYGAVSKDAAEMELDSLDAKWGSGILLSSGHGVKTGNA